MQEAGGSNPPVSILKIVEIMKNLNSILFVFILVLVLLVFVLNYFQSNTKTEESKNEKSIIKIKICNKDYFALVAADEYKRAIGFSNQTIIKDDEAILFVFPDEAVRYFWMKDTFFNLSIIFLDKNKKVVNFFDMQTCLNNDCKIYSSLKKAQYAIEIKNTNLSCLQIGQQINFSN